MPLQDIQQMEVVEPPYIARSNARKHDDAESD